MSNQQEQKNQSEEIDLGFLIKSLNQFFKKLIKLFFEAISFFLKFKLISISLLILLIVYGFYVDQKTQKVYENKIIVIPNFESVDYLYEQVESLNQKRAAQDTLVLKNIFSDNYKYFKGIEIEPYVDIYDFVSTSRENVEVFKVFAQNHDLSEYLKDVANSKYYKYHLVRFKSSGKSNSEEIKDSLLSYFNKNNHFNQYKNLFQENTSFSLQENLEMINQIDSIISGAFKLRLNDVPSQSFFMNDNSNLNGLIHTKKMLVEDRLSLSLRKNDEISTVKEVSSSYNLNDKERFYIPNKVKYPLYFLVLFFTLFFAYKAIIKLKKIAN